MGFPATRPASLPDSLKTMKCRRKPDNAPNLFCAQLAQILKLRHPLLRLSDKMDWARLETEIDLQYSPGLASRCCRVGWCWCCTF